MVIGGLLAWFSLRDSPRDPERPADVPVTAVPAPSATSGTESATFDFYLLALTVHAAFCADGHKREAECRVRNPWPLAIHGLWPEKREPRAYPRDCPAPALDLDPALSLELETLMPGMAAGLHEHEWRKHGSCSGLDDDLYFRRTMDLTRELQSALAAKLTTLAGEEVDAQTLREAAEQFRPGIGRTLTLHCRTLRGSEGRPVLMEIRQCIDNDGPGGAPGSLLDCDRIGRRDQGCGRSFLIADRP